MANNRIILKRTSTSGRTPNTTGSYSTNSQYIGAGELALNMADGILYSSNGSAVIEIGANNTNVRVTGNVTANGIVSGLELVSTNASGDEGGEVKLTKPPNGTLDGGVTIDAYQNKIRFFEQGGSARGAYIDLSACVGGAGTNLLAGGGGSGTVTSVATGNGMTGGTITNTGTVSVLANTGIVANATGVFVNATYIGTLTANNTSFVGSISAANVVSNAQLQSNLANYQTTAGLSANVATLTANNASFLGGTAAASYALLAGPTFTGTVNVSSGSFYSNNLLLQGDGTNAYIRPINSGSVLYLGANNNNHVSLVANGNLGIGTSSPSYKLHLAGAGDTTLFIGANAASNGAALLRLQGSDTSVYSAYNAIQSLNSDGSIQWAIGGQGNANTITFQTSSTNERMRITSSGNVGIGNTNPNARLQVTGTANISGNVAIAGITTFTGNVVLGSVAVSANGGVGTAGQVLTSNGSATYWATGGSSNTSVVRQSFTGDGGTTTYTVTGGYTANQIDVYVNGVKMLNGTEVTVSSGTQIVFAAAPPTSSTIEVVGFTAGNIVSANEVGGYYKGGSTSAGNASNANNVFRINSKILYNNTNINSDENASCAGPISISSGITLNIAPGGRVVIS